VPLAMQPPMLAEFDSALENTDSANHSGSKHVEASSFVTGSKDRSPRSPRSGRILRLVGMQHVGGKSSQLVTMMTDKDDYPTLLKKGDGDKRISDGKPSQQDEQMRIRRSRQRKVETAASQRCPASPDFVPEADTDLFHFASTINRHYSRPHSPKVSCSGRQRSETI